MTAGDPHAGVAAPVREALGLRAVLRPRRLHLPRGRAPVPVRDPGRVHPGAAGRAIRAGCASGGRPFPRAAAVIILYVNILAVLSLFIGYFVPKLSGDFARLFREAPQLFAKVNRSGCRAPGAWVDHALRRRGRARRTRTSSPRPGREPPAPRAIVLEPLRDGRYRVDLDALALEVRPRDGRPVRDRARRTPRSHRPGGGGKWERSIKQWLAGAAQVDRRARAGARSSTARSSSARSWPGSAACSWC